MSDKLARLAAGLIAVAAALLLAFHLRPEGSAALWTLERSQAAARAGERMAVVTPTGEINVNAAGVDELCGLHGVGPALAERIMLEREQNGRFYYPEDLLAVKGIGQKTLDGLQGQFSLK